MAWYWWVFYLLGGVGMAIPLTLLIRLLLTAVGHNRYESPSPRGGRCGGCGYLLVGLPEPRCPECGLRFDGY